jgi:phosphoglycerate dehydrogenase-like enzyme
VNILVSIHSPFVMWNIPAGHVDGLRRQFPQHTFRHATNDDQALTLIHDAEVAFSAQVTREQLEVARLLRWIHSPAAGIGSMLFPEMVERPIVITNSRGVSAQTIAEHVLAVTLALFRRLPLAFRRQREHEWAQDEISAAPGNRALAGSRILIVGLGAIGSAVAKVMSALGAQVTAIRRTSASERNPFVGEIATPVRLRALLPSADVVVVCAPQTRETRGFIGPDELQAMSPHCIIVNVSRGPLVDEDALVATLRAGRIGGAALDVFAHEPLPPDSPLWDMPNVLVTPHTSGFRADHWDAATTLFVDNLRRFEEGRLLLNVVDKLAGY